MISFASSDEKTTFPDAAPGEAGNPFATTVNFALGSNIGWSSWSRCSGSIRATASSFVINPSLTISTAVLTADNAVLFPVLV